MTHENDKKVLFITEHGAFGGGAHAFIDMLHLLPMTNQNYDVCIFKKGFPFEKFLPKETSFVTIEQAQLRKYDTAVAYVDGIPLQEWIKIPAQQRILWIHTDLSNASNDCWLRNNELLKPINTFIGVSDAASNGLKKINPSCSHKIRTIHNCINIEPFAKLANNHT